MCAAADLIVTCELAWLLAGTVVWMLLYRPKSGQPAVGVFVAGVGTVFAWPIVLGAIVLQFVQRRAWR